ncbi:polar amino acid ABC transporter inner membrane subunit [Liquorilactobacillus aquaticus DSM 21051]|uniref:Polar amino acid ABC transporter inner membrane subunit n=1 Tax=Liquorilactobacillus aquaticus DSM 21051 TaxID=1423725 RepID=A0A0R2CUF7_9LACO|nr:ABC transporter substrate-binding protein/permease [Liquorilactobacillus aquaticus]KRM95400.1 polar amino acid ABC transporter inner membrane subunit [Liquorilactobacillus aquaticus DSM 21051]
MKKFIKFLMLLLGFATFWSLSTLHVQAADNSLEKIKQSGKIVVATSPDYPPYEFQVNKHGENRIAGMDIDVAKQIAKDLHVKLVVKSMKFDSLLVAIETGKADMAIGGINPTNERRQSVDFSDIYYLGGQSFLINKSDSSKFPNQKSLQGKLVGAQTGSLQYNLAKANLANTTVKGMDKTPDLILALKIHKLEAVGVEKPVAKAYASNDNGLAIVPATYKLDKNQVGAAVAFKKNSFALEAAVNKSIKKIKKGNKIDGYLKNAGKDMKLNTVNTSMWNYSDYFAKGVKYTLFISIVSSIFGVLLGITLALMRFTKMKLFHAISLCYVEFVRGTPLMVQVMFVYFGIGSIINISALLSGIIAISLNSGAYVAEIIRGGIDSVAVGQYEAAASLGLSRRDRMRFVVLPQAFKNIWPALGNEFISLVKESSIVSIIGVTDLIYQSNLVRANTYRGIMPIFVTMLLYFVITFILTRILNHYEKKIRSRE